MSLRHAFTDVLYHPCWKRHSKEVPRFRPTVTKTTTSKHASIGSNLHKQVCITGQLFVFTQQSKQRHSKEPWRPWLLKMTRKVVISSQNICHAMSGSSPALTGVTMSDAGRLNDPMNALSRTHGMHIHNHNEKALAHSPAVSESFPAGACELRIAHDFHHESDACLCRHQEISVPTRNDPLRTAPSTNKCPITI